MTHNRAVYNETSTIVFHGSMFHENLKDLPPLEDAQYPKKAWVMNTAKAPKPFQYDPQLMSPFTHVWSHHLESDIVETYFGSGRTGNLS
ncbi:MAG: hypothetical protein JOS17DRAFT_797114 [Linnemannia elongata]|nr:MAG: hypothetical protein JOS17DRAFT_797114 [Linnemannia elongata]